MMIWIVVGMELHQDLNHKSCSLFRVQVSSCYCNELDSCSRRARIKVKSIVIGGKILLAALPQAAYYGKIDRNWG